MLMFRVPSRTTMLLLLLGLCLLTRCGCGFLVAVEEGSDAILPCSLSANIEEKVFDWKKDDRQEVFFYADGSYYGNGRTGQDEQFEGRVFHFPDELKKGNASIKITNTKMADNGSYTCTFPKQQQTSHVTLVVGAAPKPYVTILNETQDGVLLQCEVHGSPKPKVQWWDKAGNALHTREPRVSEAGGRFHVTLYATVTKAGRFRCVATQEQIKHRIHAEIYVPVSGAAAEPSITILGETNDGLQLRCLVRGASPKPVLQWQDSSGNILTAEEPQVTPRGDGYDVILQITVTETDLYRCVATQKEIEHQIYTETYVPVHGLSAGSTTAIIAGVGVVVVLVVAVVLFVVYHKKIKCNNNNQGSTPEETGLKSQEQP